MIGKTLGRSNKARRGKIPAVFDPGEECPSADPVRIQRRSNAAELSAEASTTRTTPSAFPLPPAA